MSIERLLAAATVVSSLVAGSIAGPAYGEDNIKVIGSTGVRAVVGTLARQFESDTGHKVVTDFEVFAGLKRRIDAGEAFDIAILSPVLIDDYIKQGRIASDTRIDFGRGGLGVGMRKGAPKPDIDTVAALKRTFLGAKSIAYAGRGESGVHFLALLDKLGIAEQMKTRVRPYDGPAMIDSVASGDTEFLVTSITVIIPAAGIELAGEIPSEVQSYVQFTAGINAASKSMGPARDLLRFMTGPAAAPAFKASGMRPG